MAGTSIPGEGFRSGQRYAGAARSQVAKGFGVPLGRLHVIVNVSADSDFDTVLELTKAVVGAGAPVVQLRFKGVTDAAAFELATAMAQVCAAGGTTLLVNDRVDMALAVGADGVHVGDDD